MMYMTISDTVALYTGVSRSVEFTIVKTNHSFQINMTVPREGYSVYLTVEKKVLTGKEGFSATMSSLGETSRYFLQNPVVEDICKKELEFARAELRKHVPPITNSDGVVRYYRSMLNILERRRRSEASVSRGDELENLHRLEGTISAYKEILALLSERSLFETIKVIEKKCSFVSTPVEKAASMEDLHAQLQAKWQLSAKQQAFANQTEYLAMLLRDTNEANLKFNTQGATTGRLRSTD